MKLSDDEEAQLKEAANNFYNTRWWQFNRRYDAAERYKRLMFKAAIKEASPYPQPVISPTHSCSCHLRHIRCSVCLSISCRDADCEGRATPREEFEEVFGQVTDEQWQWLKEFCLRNPSR